MMICRGFENSARFTIIARSDRMDWQYFLRFYSFFSEDILQMKEHCPYNTICLIANFAELSEPRCLIFILIFPSHSAIQQQSVIPITSNCLYLSNSIFKISIDSLSLTTRLSLSHTEFAPFPLLSFIHLLLFITVLIWLKF